MALAFKKKDFKVYSKRLFVTLLQRKPFKNFRIHPKQNAQNAIGVFSLLKCQIELTFKACSQLIGLILDTAFKWRMSPDLEVCFVEIILRNNLTQKNLVKK